MYWALLRRNRDFRRLWTADLISLGGDWFNVVALTGLLLRLTGSAAAGGEVLAAGLLPMFLLAPIAGVVADRFDRRRLMILSDVVAAGLALLMLAVRTPGTAWLGLAALACIAVAGAFFDPASRAGLPNVVSPSELAAANVLMASNWGVMAAVGAGLGGVVVAVAGQDVAFVVNAASFLVSAGLALGVRAKLGPLPGEGGGEGAGQAAATRTRVRPLRDLREGLAWARTDGRVMSLLAQKLGFGLGTGMIGLLPLFATRTFGAGEAGIGLLLAARGLGSLIGPFGARWFIRSDLSRLFPALGSAMLLFGLAYLVFPSSPGIWVAAGVLVVAHAGGGTQWTMTGYGLQHLSPDWVRGRILAMELGLVTLSMSLSMLGAGVVASWVDPRLVVRVLAGVTVAYAVGWSLATRRFWAGPGSARAVPHPGSSATPDWPIVEA